MWEVAKLKPYVNNPRKNDKAVAAVAESIKQFGFNVPITVDKDGVIATGHTMELDPKYVDVIVERWETFTRKRARKEGENYETILN